MNLANQPSDSNSNLLFVNFNQDYTSLAVGTKSSYRLFSLTSVDKLEQIYEHDSEDICIVERLFSSSLVAVVSLTAPRKLKVCHFKKGTEICNYSYSNTILAVKLNRKRLIVALEESLYVHNIRDMKVLHTIRDTPPNPNGLCALSISNDNCYLAYPGSSQIGEVQIFDTVNLQAVTMISAHNSPLAALAFDTSGTKLATASEKGTVIRVFSIPDGKKLFEFRRGVKRCVSINSLAFSADSIFLCASSNTETVHIFKLEQPKEKPAEEPSTWMGYLGKALMTPANYLPSQVTEVLTQDRAFAIVKLPFSGLKNVCALANVATKGSWDISHPITDSISKPRVLVAAADGFIYIYNLDPTDGGDCTLLKQHRLDGQADTGTGGLLGATAGGSEGAAGAAGSEDQSEGAEATGGVLGGEQAALGYSPGPAKTFASATGGSRNVDLLSSSPHRSPAREPILPSTVDHRHDELLVAAETDDSQFSPPGMSTGLNQLRLDDDNEFPPMMQHTE